MKTHIQNICLQVSKEDINSICIISGQYDENSIEIAKQYQKHVPAIECMCIKDTRHLPQIEQPEGFAEQLDILFSAE
jgi:pimeloyl-ACP methyl ester carboxylesterase